MDCGEALTNRVVPSTAVEAVLDAMASVVEARLTALDRSSAQPFRHIKNDNCKEGTCTRSNT